MEKLCLQKACELCLFALRIVSLIAQKGTMCTKSNGILDFEKKKKQNANEFFHTNIVSLRSESK